MYQLKSSASPSDRGQEHGETYKTQIKELFEIRQYLLLKFLPEFSAEEIHRLSMEHVEALKDYPHLYEEFIGISDASGLASADLMVLNNYTDMRDFSSVALDKDVDEGGCTVFATKGPSGVVIGQTWDMHASARPYMLQMDLSGETDGQRWHQQVLTVTGCLALAGMNSHGVAVMINNLHCKETHVGMAWGALVRKMLEQPSAPEAHAFIKNNLPSSGHNYLVADPKMILNLESTGKQVDLSEEVIGESGQVVHTNHYLGRLAEYEILARRSPTTDVRLAGIQRYFAQHLDSSQWTMDRLSEDLFGGKKVPEIMVPEPKEPHQSMTCGGLICDLGNQQGQVFGGVYDPGDRGPFSF